MIEIKNVSLKIKDAVILDDISCNIEENTLTAVIGPNGSGKSSLLKCVTRFVKYSGQIAIDRQASLAGFNLAKKIAYLPQSRTIIFPHTVYDTVLMGRRPYSAYCYTQRDKELTEKSIDEMNLSNIRERKIDKLSGGELQKTFFARAVVQDTKYMLLDEPFNNLDPYYQSAIIRKISELKNKKTIVVVLHDISLLRFFDTVIMIKNGAIVKEDLNRESLERLYDVPFIELSDGEKTFYAPTLF